jgi:ParB family chromosome partitioning protein
VSKKALGKGLDALIPQGVMASLDVEKLTHIPVERIRANPYQPRKRFDDESLHSLAASVKTDGVLQPVVVRRTGDHYELIMGERRLQAARLAGVPSIPAVVRTATDADTLRLALVENLQRENLNPIEVAEAYKALSEKFGLSQQELAGMVGKDRSSVANTLRLLGLPEEIRAMIAEDKLSEGHARALLSLATKAEQLAWAKKIVEQQLAVRTVEAELLSRKPRRGTSRRRKEKPAHITQLENAFAQHLSTRVAIDERRGGRGRIVIEFFGHEDFERIAGVLNLPLPR